MISNLLKNIIYSNNLLFKVYYKRIWRPTDELYLFLSKISRPKLEFIQIGANDGQWNDPLYKFIRMDSWKGILIEPQPDIFLKLKQNYSFGENLIFENCAIGDTDGQKELFRISFTNAKWASGLSSFNKTDVQRMVDAGYVERNAIADNITTPPNKTEWIKGVMVNMVSLLTLINKHKLESIDLLMIDVEGYEFEILKTIPFQNIKIKYIIFEHSHFNSLKRQEIEDYLRSKNYSFCHFASDTLATYQAN